MEGLPSELYVLCRQVLLDCDQFESHQRLRSFCRGHTALLPLNFKLEQASNCEALIELNLPIFIEEEQRSKVKNPSEYIKMGSLGRAFQNSQRTVVLIDEIDKADIDFPNDLLQALDEGWFTIQEIGEEIKAKQPPIIFITSNDEKDLPDAFLRRCLFHYIELPFSLIVFLVACAMPLVVSYYNWFKLGNVLSLATFLLSKTLPKTYITPIWK